MPPMVAEISIAESKLLGEIGVGMFGTALPLNANPKILRKILPCAIVHPK
jgi:hypothetical protein